MTSASSQWEYHFVSKPLDYLLVGDLNELGKDGWEAFSISYNKDLKGNWSWTAFFKRPLAEGGKAEVVVRTATTAGGSPSAQTRQSAASAGQKAKAFEMPDGDFNFQ